MVKKCLKQLNKFETQLQQDIEDLMREHKVKFTVFLDVLREDLPKDTTSNEYRTKHRAEYLKQLRASYSVEEVKKMLAVLGYEIKFTHKDKLIQPNSFVVEGIKTKYTELMAICEMLAIKITWQKSVIEGVENNTSKLTVKPSRKIQEF